MASITRFVLVTALCVSSDAGAFVHVVRPKESLADISKRLYGDSAHEGLVAGANALDVQGGSAIVPGMHLQIPACDYHRVTEHETWASIARELLGDDARADHLARMNDTVAWVAPAVGQEVRVPYVLTYIAAEGDTTLAVARRYLGDANRAWEIDAYNGRRDWKLLRGEVVLVPLSNLELTDVGRLEAAAEGTRTRREAGGQALGHQRKAQVDITALLADTRAGRYVDAVARGNRLLGQSDLTQVQLASVQRALVEAYVALAQPGPAALACDEWRKLEPATKLDPVYVSPKIRDACRATR
jgi:LysM repeat protein